MRDVLHAFAMAAVIAVAALCMLVQLSDVNHAFDQLGHDGQAVIQQVSSGTDHATSHGPDHATKQSGQHRQARQTTAD